MEPQNARTPPEQSQLEEPPTPKKRFQIVKLEERIAPKRGGKGTNNTCGCSSASSGLATTGCYTSIF